MTTLFEYPAKGTAKLLRSRLGARVRYTIWGHVRVGFGHLRVPDGRTGEGYLEEVKGRNVRIGEGDWLWLPDISAMWILPAPEELK